MKDWYTEDEVDDLLDDEDYSVVNVKVVNIAEDLLGEVECLITTHDLNMIQSMDEGDLYKAKVVVICNNSKIGLNSGQVFKAFFDNPNNCKGMYTKEY